MIAKVLRVLAAALVAAPVALALAGSATAQSGVSVNDAERATVRVAVIAEDGSGGRTLYGTGSGFVVAPNLVVTNAHVVSAARQQANFGIAVVPPEGDGMIAARIIQFSPLSDLALLEFRGGPDIPAVTISSLEPHPGDAIIALGFPDVDDLHRPADELVRPTLPSRTTGSIASLRDRAPTGDPIPTINHEAVISSGSSGGPLLDECGRVIGVNTWHARGEDTQESRSVASRASQLLDFLQDAGVTPQTTSQRCLSFAERVEAERAATVDALQVQNRDLTSKLEMADRLTRTAVVILIGGTLALFVAVGVLGALLLSRRTPHPAHPAPEHAHEPHKKSALGVAAVVGGAAVAAIIVLAAGVALLHARGEHAQSVHLSGAMSCTLDRTASRDPGDADELSFTVTGDMCVNQRLTYAAAHDGRWQRVLLVSGQQALDVLTIDPATSEYRRDRYVLSQSAYSAAGAAANEAPPDSCSTANARDIVARRNAALIRFAEGQPAQRQVWRCAPAEAGR